jgi:hypothetical protein
MAKLVSIDPLEIRKRLGSTLQQESGLYKMMWPVDLYLHIPFCNSTCMYCPFYKILAFDQNKISNYLRSIVDEINLWKEVLDFNRLWVNSIYVGGGTTNLAVFAPVPMTEAEETIIVENPDIFIPYYFVPTEDFVYKAETAHLFVEKVGGNRPRDHKEYNFGSL